MPTYKAPVGDTLFLLNDVFDYAKYANAAGFSDAPIDVVEAVLSEGAKFVEEVIQPLNRSGDVEGCKRQEDGSVTTPRGFKAAYKALVEGGWVGLAGDPEYGGQGLPHFLAVLFSEYEFSANLAFSMYPSLTNGAVAALMTHGSDELKARYLPRMTTGEWTGTMNLTEPHCGTDLGLIKTKAVPQPDGSYAITGQKIFISAGEHDLADNIIHLALARIEGAPAGVKGISLFLVPKFLPNADGAPGERNGVVCGSIEHKMGIHGNSTAIINYDGAKGWLVGEEHRGLPAMFVMMNGARLGVAVQGLAISEVAYQNAAAYAKDRRQGRSLRGPVEPDKPADILLVHPDVRRMLLEIRAFNEAARALLVWIALTQDESHVSPDAATRQAADDRLGLMTPVLKGVFTDLGFANAVKAQQVLGGHGYVAEWGMEQFVRDARIAMIYEIFMSAQQHLATGDQSDRDLYARERVVNSGIAAADISRGREEYLEIVDAFYADDVEVTTDTDTWQRAHSAPIQHSAWSVNLVGVSGRACALNWCTLRRWADSRVVYERHYDHQQSGGPFTGDDLSLNQSRAPLGYGRPF